MKRLVVLVLFAAGAAIAASMGPTASMGSGSGAAAPAASVTYPAITNVQVGGYVSLAPTVTGITPGTYTVVGGALPDGLSLNSSTGAITGTTTTTALKANAKAGLGASPDLGEHTVIIDAGDDASTRAAVQINVYAIDIPNPQSLFVASAAYDSGSNFLDAMDGSTFTQTNGTQDSNLTDATSPLGYAHKFNSTVYFSRATEPTKPDPIHATVAILQRRADNQAGQAAQDHFSIGDTGNGNGGLLIQTPTRFYQSFQVQGATVSTTRDAFAWESTIGVADEGVGYREWLNGTLTSTAHTGAMVMSTGSLLVGTGELHAYPRMSASSISEVGYWPRVVDAAQAASIDWCWFRGISLKDCIGTNAPTATVTITPTAPAYERPVTCTGSYTLTGASANADEVTWYASPSGDSGTCTGTSSYSCAVTVSPDATGEGVTTVSITATGSEGGGQVAIARQDVGFYVTGARDCFLSQNIDGDNNATNADNDAVAAWVNLINANRSVTQGTAGSRPSVQEGVGSGVYVQPLVRFDGGDFLDDDTASDWTWMHNGTDNTVSVVFSADSTVANQQLLNTNDNATGACTNGGKGFCMRIGEGSSVATFALKNGTGNAISNATGANAVVSGKFHSYLWQLDDDGGGGADGLQIIDGSTVASPTAAASYATDGGTFLRVGKATGSSGEALTGNMFRIITYQFALTSTQRGINKAVDEWALGNSLPVNP